MLLLLLLLLLPLLVLWRVRNCCKCVCARLVRCVSDSRILRKSKFTAVQVIDDMRDGLGRQKNKNQAKL